MPNINRITKKIQIAIFASGNGSNAENLITYFNKSNSAQVNLILTNNQDAGVISRAKRHNVPVFVFDKKDLQYSTKVEQALENHHTNWIVLAGFLLLFPKKLIALYPNKIINLHPALLPKYGGKGMYGMHVHKAVAENKEIETGITIHFVNEAYDEGTIIFQAKTKVLNTDTPEMIADKIHVLEQKHFPKVIEKLIITKKSSTSLGGG